MVALPANRKLLVALGALTLALTLASAGARAAPAEQSSAEEAAARVALFDFANYKRQFGKTYSGLLEELVRQKYFFSRATRAFISAVKYKYHDSPFYLAVNAMSDWLPAQIDKMRNKVLERQGAADAPAPNVTPIELADEHEADVGVPADVAAAKAELSKLAQEHPGEPGFRELGEALGGVATNSGGRGARRKRSAEEVFRGPVRELPMARLINTGAGVDYDPETRAKIVARVESNNPQYEPIEVPSFGLKDNQLDLNWWSAEAPLVDLETMKTNVASGLSRLGSSLMFGSFGGLAPGPEQTPPDEVFQDLRDSKCFLLPRSQGACGSCYAFAMISILEWLYCKQTGQLVPFSEQYVVDCGNDFVQGIDGCGGGETAATAKFVQNFGLELRSNYPYQMSQHKCPYDADQELNSTGYVRAPLNDALMVSEKLFPRFLKISPLFVAISTASGFSEYGGGVHGYGCDQKKSSHAMVIVGHGREDGREYWLIRNSHSVGWGEGGYYKLAKDAGCIVSHSAFTFGTNTNKITLEPQLNPINNGSQVKAHYSKMRMQSV